MRKMTKTPTTEVGVVITDYLNANNMHTNRLADLSGVPSCTVVSYRTGGIALKPKSKHVKMLATAMNYSYAGLKKKATKDTQDFALAEKKSGPLGKTLIKGPRAAVAAAPVSVPTLGISPGYLIALEAKIDAMAKQVKSLVDVFSP